MNGCGRRWSHEGVVARRLSRSFVHLHLHTEYSMLDGAARDRATSSPRAVADGQPAVGITDHGNMYGVLDFYRPRATPASSRSSARRRTSSTTSRLRPAAARRARHLPPHAARREQRRATATSSRCRRRAYLDGFYYKPRVDFELLEQHHEGLVAHERLPRRARCARRCSPTTTPARCELAARFQRHLRPRHRSSSSSRTTASPTSTASTAALLRIARDARRAAARHQRQPLHAPGRRRGARRAAVRADRHARSTTRTASSSRPTSST